MMKMIVATTIIQGRNRKLDISSVCTIVSVINHRNVLSQEILLYLVYLLIQNGWIPEGALRSLSLFIITK